MSVESGGGPPILDYTMDTSETSRKSQVCPMDKIPPSGSVLDIHQRNAVIGNVVDKTPNPLVPPSTYRITDCPPYIVVMESLSGEGAGIARLHPMAIGKLLQQLVPPVSPSIVSIQKTGRNRVQVTLSNVLSANNLIKNADLAAKKFRAYMPIHLARRKGVIRGVDPTLTNEEIMQCIEGENNTKLEILDLARMTRKVYTSDGTVTRVPTSSMIATFRGQSLPAKVRIFHVSCQVQPFVQNVVQCRGCLRFGHYLDNCKSKNKICDACGEACDESHSEQSCKEKQPFCINCKGEHKATDKEKCIKFEFEKKVKKLMADSNLSYWDAKRSLAEPSYARVVGDITPPPPKATDTRLFPSLNLSRPKPSTLVRSIKGSVRPALRLQTTKRKKPSNSPTSPPFPPIPRDLYYNYQPKNRPGGYVNLNNFVKDGPSGIKDFSNQDYSQQSVTKDSARAYEFAMNVVRIIGKLDSHERSEDSIRDIIKNNIEKGLLSL